MIGPTPNLAPRQPIRDRRPSPAGRTYGVEEAVGASPVTRPVTSDDICLIASKGYPLWESIATMQLRNRRITVAYHDLSQRLAEVIAGDEEVRDANWCTFATWTSKTVGNWIEDDVVPEPLHDMRRVPRFVVQGLMALTRWLIQRSNGATYRCLAAGNRFVFLEIGFAVALFIERFAAIDRTHLAAAENHWASYWDSVQARVTELSQLDPSWMLTDAPEPLDLRLGLRQYFEAIFATDPDERAELILAGTLLIGAYEQRRVDGYVSASLALFTKRAMRNLVRNRSGLVPGWFRRLPSCLFARIMTRALVLNIPGEQLKVGRPLPCPGGGDGLMFTPDLETITLPLLQALVTRYDLSDGKPRQRRARDWTSYDDRMTYITNLFRSRQQNPRLFDAPFPSEVETALLSGRLHEDSTPQVVSTDGDQERRIKGSEWDRVFVRGTTLSTE